MKLIKYKLLLLCCWATFNINAQQSEIEKPKLPTFRTFKIGNLQSTTIAEKGVFYGNLSYRLGAANGNFSTIFDFNNSVTKLELIYGLTKKIQISIGGESLRKTYNASAKVAFLEQTNNFPVNIVGYATINTNTELSQEQYPLMKFFDRLSYASQVLISRRLSNGLSLEIAPTFIRQNLVLEPFQQHNQIALGFGGSLRMSKNLSLNIDYTYNFNRAAASVYNDPFTLTLDIEKKRYIFQLTCSNAQSTNEPSFISNAEGSWADLKVFLGFNVIGKF